MNDNVLLVKPSQTEGYIYLREDILNIILSDVIASIEKDILLEHKDNKCSQKCIKRGIDIGVKRFLSVISAYEKASKGK